MLIEKFLITIIEDIDYCSAVILNLRWDNITWDQLGIKETLALILIPAPEPY